MAWTDTKCGKTIRGNNQHCPNCHNTFTSTRAGDAHRTGPYETRTCLNPADVPHIDRHGNNTGLLLEQNQHGAWRIKTNEHDAATYAAFLATKETPTTSPRQ